MKLKSKEELVKMYKNDLIILEKDLEEKRIIHKNKYNHIDENIYFRSEFDKIEEIKHYIYWYSLPEIEQELIKAKQNINFYENKIIRIKLDIVRAEDRVKEEKINLINAKKDLEKAQEKLAEVEKDKLIIEMAGIKDDK